MFHSILCTTNLFMVDLKKKIGFFRPTAAPFHPLKKFGKESIEYYQIPLCGDNKIFNFKIEYFYL